MFNLAAAVAMAGCQGPLSTLDPGGPSAAAIANLWWLMLGGAGVLFVLVMGLFALAFLRPGWGTSVSPHRWILLGGLLLPALVLPPLVAYGLLAGERLLPLPGIAPPRIEVQAERWRWIFHYPDHGGLTTENLLYLPAGTPVDIVVTSRDVIHSFWIPRLSGKVDAVPGRTNVLRIQADEPGHYEGLCAEFCGLRHAIMRFDVDVRAAGDLSAAIAAGNAALQEKE